MEVISALSYFTAFLALIYVFILCILIRGWLRLPYFKPNTNAPHTKVSILIAARNEEDNLHRTIKDLLAQDYPKELTEIIIIDDHSTDSTAEIIRSYAGQGVKLIQLNESNALNSYKKKAIQLGIGQSAGTLIITTDADCWMGPAWLKTIVNFYETYGFKMISSPVAYGDEKRFFERLQTLEFSYLIGLGAATIGNKNPGTCNGANLAYEKAAFYEVGGFSGIDDLASGDDELLLHKMTAIYGNQIGFLKNRSAVVYTHAKATVSEFFQQRKRWASKTTRYKQNSFTIISIAIWLFNVSILVNTILSIFFPDSLKFLLFQLACKLGIEFIFLNQISGFFKRKQLLVLLPVINVVHIFYMIYIGIAGNTGKYNWKGRMVK